MAADLDALTARILTLLGEAAYEKAFPEIGSRTLRDAMRLIVETTHSEARLYIPHYWAVYYHDGRGGFGPRTANFLVYFNDPHDDPRLPRGQFPERFAELRRLTRAEFYDGLRENDHRRALGMPPFMFVIKNADGSPGTVGPAAAHPFFTDGMQGFGASQSGPDSAVAQALDDYIQRIIDEGLTDSDSADIPIF